MLSLSRSARLALTPCICQVLFTMGDEEETAAAAATAGSNDARVAADRTALLRMQSFMQWLTATLVSGLYPGSPYERRFFALELLSAVLETWGPDGSGAPPAAAAGGTAGSGAEAGGGGKGGKGGRQGSSVKGLAERQGGGGRMAESTSLSLLPSRYLQVCGRVETRGVFEDQPRVARSANDPAAVCRVPCHAAGRQAGWSNPCDPARILPTMKEKAFAM